MTVGIFQLPAGTRIPLHNHPGMNVLSRLLWGTLHVKAYDWVPGSREAEGPEGMSRAAQLVMDSTLTAPHAEPLVLYPDAGGNKHEFTALTPCAVLDLLLPPYAPPDGWDCTYYQEGDVLDPQRGVVILQECEEPETFRVVQGKYRGVQVAA